MMLKTITFLSKFFILLIVSFLIFFIATLIFGINLTNLSYGDISVSQLYLKYDKKLIVNIKNLKIKDKNGTKSQIFSGNISVAKLDKRYFIELDNIYYENIGLRVSGNTYLSSKDIDSLIEDKEKRVVLNNVKVNYDKHLSDVVAKKVFLYFNSKDLIITFKSPSMDGVKLDGSKVILQDITSNLMLKLDLYTHNSLDKNILNIVKYYGVDIPVVEKQGYNSVNFKLDLPFDDRDMKIYLKANIKDAIIDFGGIDFISKDVDILYQNSILKINSNEVDLVFLNRPYILDNISMVLDKDIINIDTNIFDENNNSFDTNSSLNLTTKKVTGDIDVLDYKFNNIKVNNQYLKYNLDFNNSSNINIDINSKDKQTQFSILDKNITCEDLKVNINNNIVKVDGVLKDKNNSLIVSNSTYIDDNISRGDILIKNFKYDRYITLKDRLLNYKVDITKGIDIIIPQYGLRYIKKDKNNQSTTITKLDNILKDIPFVKVKNRDKNSSLKIFTSNNYISTNMIFDNLALDINSTKLLDKKENNSTRILPTLYIKVFNSDIKYDNNEINVSRSQIDTKNRKIKINIIPKKENFTIFVDIYDKNITIKSDRMSPIFVNSLFHKDIFKDGYVNLDANGTFDILDAKVKFHKTTVQNVMVLNNLITFINTTPAIINPVLALPTLFRMGETGFDMTGYYIEKGFVTFRYNIDKDYINIKKVHTKSTMTDFDGHGKVDIKNRNLKVHMDVIFLKDYSKAINYIPIVGYIVTGDDGNFVTSVDIKGTFDKQSFETHTVKNASHGVFNVIKRTLSVPFLPFMDNNKTKKK